jgi:hypothetical protein
MPKLRFLLLPFLSLAARASTSLTVSIADITPKPSPGSYVEADLQNCTNPTLLNTSQTVTNPQKFFFNTLNPQLTITLPDNISQISCNGNQLSYWAIYYVNATGSVRTLLKSVELPAGTFTLANLANLTTPPWNPGVIQGPPGQDAVPANLAGDVTGAINTTTINTIQGHPVTPVVLSGSYTDLTNKPTIPSPLTAGNNISITGSTISATVPSYTGGTGISITQAGSNAYTITNTGGGGGSSSGTPQNVAVYASGSGSQPLATATNIQTDPTYSDLYIRNLYAKGPNAGSGRAIHMSPYAAGDQTGFDLDMPAGQTFNSPSGCGSNQTNRWQFVMAGDYTFQIFNNTDCNSPLVIQPSGNNVSIFPTAAGTFTVNAANSPTPVNLNGQLVRTYINPNGGYAHSFTDQTTYTRDSDIWTSRNMGILNGHHEEASAVGGNGLDFQFHDYNIIARCGVTFPTQEGCHMDQRRTSSEAQMSIGSLYGAYGAHGVELQLSQGQNNLAAGQPVFDITTVQSFTVSGACSATTCPVSGTVAASKNGTLTAAANIPNGTSYAAGASTTFGVTWVGATPATTDLCTISGASKPEPPFFPTAISSTSVTGILRENHTSGDTIACGGMVGKFVENPAKTGTAPIFMAVEQVIGSTTNSISFASGFYGNSVVSLIAASGPTTLNFYTGAFVADPGDPYQGGIYTGGGFVATDTALTWTPGHTVYQTNTLAEVFQQDLDNDTLLNPYNYGFDTRHASRHTQLLGGPGWTGGAYTELFANSQISQMVPFSMQTGGFTGMYWGGPIDTFPQWAGSLGGTRAMFANGNVGSTPFCAFEFFGNGSAECLSYDPNTHIWNVPHLLTTGGPLTIATTGYDGTADYSVKLQAVGGAYPRMLGTWYTDSAGTYKGRKAYCTNGECLTATGNPGGFTSVHPLSNEPLAALIQNSWFTQMEGQHEYWVGTDADTTATLDIGPGVVLVNGSPVCTTTSGGCGSGGASFTPSAIQFATTSSATRAATASDLYSLFSMDTVNSTVIPFNYGSGGAPTAPTSGQQLEASSSGIAVLHDSTGTIQPVIAGTVTTVTLAPVGGQPYSLATASIVSLSHSPVCFASAVTPDPTMLPAGMPSVGTPVSTGTLTWSVPIYVYGSATNAVNVLCN